MKKSVIIIGMGEIGSSIYGLYEGSQHKVYTYDVKHKRNGMPKGVDFMHIAIPGDLKDFDKIVCDYINKYEPQITIIHSSIPLGMTDKISEKSKAIIAHSYCMGVHPNLTVAMRTFKKAVGCRSQETAEKIYSHFKTIGVTCMTFDSPKETEAAKIIDTTYYGWNIIFMKEVKKYCDKNGLNFQQVYTETNHNYNEGYEKLNMPWVRRPVLRYIPGVSDKPIGGHCVLTNARILGKTFKPAEIILQLDDKVRV